MSAIGDRADAILARMRADRSHPWPHRLIARLAAIPEPPDALTERERQVVECFSRGLGKRGTAELLWLSPHTVDCHTASARRKLRAKNITHAACEALRLGIIR